MKKDFHGVEKQEKQEVSSTPVDTSNMSVQERLKYLNKGGARGSTVNEPKIDRNLHPSHVNSAFLNGTNLITTDYTGFIKMLKIK